MRDGGFEACCPAAVGDGAPVTLSHTITPPRRGHQSEDRCGVAGGRGRAPPPPRRTRLVSGSPNAAPCATPPRAERSPAPRAPPRPPGAPRPRGSAATCRPTREQASPRPAQPFTPNLGLSPARRSGRRGGLEPGCEARLWRRTGPAGPNKAKLPLFLPTSA